MLQLHRFFPEDDAHEKIELCSRANSKSQNSAQKLNTKKLGKKKQKKKRKA
jgi:hypothetical protein